MSVDWSATGTMLQGWGTLLGAGAVIYAAKKGADTYDSWRRQKFAERRRDQAERILTAVYKCRRALRYVRGVIIWGHELTAAENSLKEDEAQWRVQPSDRQKRMITSQALFNRLNRTIDEQRELSECLPMARALFGERLEEALELLHHQFRLVELDIEAHIDDVGQDAEFSRKIRRGMQDVQPQDGSVNEISDQIRSSIAVVEEECLPALRLT